MTAPSRSCGTRLHFSTPTRPRRAILSDIGGAELSFAKIKATASDNPAELALAEMDAELQRLTLLRRSHADEQFRIRSAVRQLPEDIAWLGRRAENLSANHAMAEADETITIGSRTLDREDAVEAMNEMLKNLLARVRKDEQTWSIGIYRGFKLSLRARAEFMPELIVAGRTREDIDFRGIAAGRLVNQIDRLLEDLPEKARKATEEAQLDGYRARVGFGVRARGRTGLFAAPAERAGKAADHRGGPGRHGSGLRAVPSREGGHGCRTLVEAEPIAVIEPSAVSAAPVQVEAPA